MHFVANPINLRLGFSKYWNNVWSLSKNINYSYLTNFDMDIKKYLFYYFEQYNFLVKSFVISNILLTRVYKRLNIYIFIRNNDWGDEIWKIFVNLRKKFLLDNNKLINYYHKKSLNYGDVFEQILVDFPKFTINKSLVLKSIKNLDDAVSYKRLRKFFSDRKLNFWFIFFNKINIIFRYKLRRHWLWLCYKVLLKLIKLYLDYLFLIKQNRYVRHTLRNLYLYLAIYKLFFMKLFSGFVYSNTIAINKFFLTKYDICSNIFFILEPFIIITAKYLCIYIKLRLRQLHPIRKIIKYLFEKIADIGIKIKHDFGGIKIVATGRFTRRDRKIYVWKCDGKVNQANISAFVDYYSTSIVLKNSTCGIRVWVNQCIDYNLKLPMNKRILNTFLFNSRVVENYGFILTKNNNG